MTAALLLGAVSAAIAARMVIGVGRAPTRAPLPTRRRSDRGPLAALGRAVRRVGRATESDRRADRRVGALTLVVVSTLPVFPPLGLALAAGAWVRVRTRRVRGHRDQERAVADGLPEAVDLLLLCCGAGIALPLAHPLVAAHLPPPIGPALQAADVGTSAGRARADALVTELACLGDRATALAHVLADHLRYGVPLAPALERLGLELRLDRRRRAEQDARRVPIRLLGPLVTCVLPAFGLLTVVPLLVASLRSLPT